VGVVQQVSPVSGQAMVHRAALNRRRLMAMRTWIAGLLINNSRRLV
jgi:hypothetical protein